MAHAPSKSAQERNQPQAGGLEQERLSAARVLLVGAGARGSVVAGYLTAAGVGHLSVADAETVGVADLSRGLLHFTPDTDANKAEAIAAKLGFLNPQVQVDPYPVAVDELNAAAIVEGHGLVVDCSGDPVAGVALNAACAAAGAPMVHVAAGGATVSVTVASPGRGACLECAVMKHPADRLAPRASGPLAGIAGSLAADVAIGLIGAGEAEDRLISLDLERGRFETLALERREGCSACARFGGLVEAGT